mmetsp:Transcript_24667/g.38358  ORF Transcript_24667/g.38358 Transcript_24667/m.38358 type:complete len:228 (-) Transcript_24667:749-1432(-)
MQVNSHNFLGHGALELASSHVSLLWSDVEAVSSFVSAGSRLELVLNNLPCALLSASVGDRLEDVLSSWLVLLNWLGIVVADSRVGLLEVDVDRDWLYVVQRVLLVEGQTEFSLGVEPGSRDVLLHSLGVILARSNLNSRIILELIGCNLETVGLRHEAVKNSPSALALPCKLLLERLVITVLARARFLVEVFFELNLGIEPSLLHAERVVLLILATSMGERREAGLS